MSPAALIAVDWGTSSLRLALLDAAGHLLDRRDGPTGVLAVLAAAEASGEPVATAFRAILATETAAWRAMAPAMDIVVSGMAGSRQGWVETPYLPCPAGLAAFGSALHAVDSDCGRCVIVPGLAVTTPDGVPDVMRGEETQIFGALQRLGLRDGIFVLPGTHSKWATVAGGAIAGFATYMTGEVFAALRSHTILGRLMSAGDAHDDAAFAQGVRAGAAEGAPGALLHRIFSARTLGLFERIPATGLASHLSGLLIGAEWAAAHVDAETPVVVIGSATLTARYCAAAAVLGRTTIAAPPDCAAHGAFALYRHAFAKG
jgi:2-dehydro-3-deoxygalactonokinase